MTIDGRKAEAPAMASAMHRHAALVATGLLSGCVCGPGVLGELPGDTESTGETTMNGTGTADEGVDSTSADDGPEKGEWQQIQFTVNKAVDILFVIDNSASMAGRQATLAANFPAFLNVLEAEDVQAEFRIAVTTTDLGNPWCGMTSPEMGAFVASACTERIDDFTAADVDVSSSACLDSCPLATLGITPSTTELDDTPRPRPWIESIAGLSNVTGEFTMVQIAQCMLPQGIAGCDFIAPLEAARRALDRARTPMDSAYGFLRQRAHLAVVFVTDGDDCSSPFEQRAIFLHPDDCYDADGDGDATDDCTQVFWSDPDAAEPSPAVCWNAGTACTGAMPQQDGTTSFDECTPVDRGLDGAITTGEPVLASLSEYTAMFEELRAEKDGTAEVLPLAVIGVPIPPEDPIAFATSPDPLFQAEHGIGPACGSVDLGVLATPAVRLRELVTTYHGLEAGALASICASDFSPVFDPIAELMRDQLEPACVPACVADLDPSTPALDFDCELRQTAPPDSDPVVTTVPQCIGEGEVPDGVDVCWVPITEPEAIDPICVSEGWNLEARLIRRDGHPVPGGTAVEVRCVSTDQPPDGVCPGL